jgi:predicted AlkP superfamily phosphohydrolase/phosphomutase
VLAVVSIDATDPARLDRLAGEGRMPNLAALRDRGRAHRVEVPHLLRLMEPATFYTLAMGLPAETHGRCLPFVWDPESMCMRLGGAPEMPALWDRMTRAGRRSLVIDAYEIGEPAEIEGAFIRGLQHRNRVSVPRADRPRELGREARRALGPPPVLNEIYGRPSAAKLRRERDRLLRGALKPAEAVEVLLPRVEPDLLWVTMLSAHVAGHRFWNLSQASGDTAGLEGTLDDVYSAADEGLGRIAAALPAGADLIVVSPVGMGENNSRIDLIEGMVDSVAANGDAPSAERGPSSVWKIRGRIPGGLRERAADLLPERAALELMLRLVTPKRDWSRTRAICLPSDPNGYLRLNLKGREAAGVLSKADVVPFVENLREGLMGFEDIEGGTAVAGVHDLFNDVKGGEAGPEVDHLPDVLVEWAPRPATSVSGVTSPRHGTIRRAGGPGGPTGRSGGHVADAWLVAVPGRGSRIADGPPARLEDVAATACARRGADAAGLTGRPLMVG